MNIVKKNLYLIIINKTIENILISENLIYVIQNKTLFVVIKRFV